MSTLLDIFSEHFFIIIYILVVLFRVFNKSQEEITEPISDEFIMDTEELEGFGGYQSPSSSSSPTEIYSQGERYRMNEQQIQATWLKIERNFEEAELVLTRVKEKGEPYLDTFRLCSPQLIEIIEEQNKEISQYKRILFEFKSYINEGLDPEKERQLLSLQTKTLELLSVQSLLLDLYLGLPSPQEFTEAYSLLMHDILPFVEHQKADSHELSTHFLPLPRRLKALDKKLAHAFPHRLPRFFVNFEYLAEPALWPLIGRETPKLLAQLYPEWSTDWRRWKGHQHTRGVRLPTKHRRTLKWPVLDSLNVWADQLLAVYFMTLRYGPAGTKALIEEVAHHYDIGDPEIATVGAQPKRRQYQTKVAPPIITVALSLGTLKRNGYLREAEQIEKSWYDKVGEKIYLLLQNTAVVPFPFELIDQDIQVWLNQLADCTWPHWRGERFEAIAGLTLSRGQWGQVINHGQQLVEGDRSLVLPSAIRWVTFAHVAQTSPNQVARVLKAAQLYHFDRKSFATDQNNHESVSEQDDILAALLLPDLLTAKYQPSRNRIF